MGVLLRTEQIVLAKFVESDNFLLSLSPTHGFLKYVGISGLFFEFEYSFYLFLCTTLCYLRIGDRRQNVFPKA